MSVVTTPFGIMPDGTPVELFTLTSAGGLVVKVTNYGGTITELLAPDRDGRLGDVVLGFDDLAGYLGNRDYIGCTVGRVANRIAGGRFALDGKSHHLTLNSGVDHLHGGRIGFDKVVWRAEPLADGAAGVRLRHTSPDGHEGYPGRLDAVVDMKLTGRHELTIEYAAISDRPTPVNLTNHTYFNLSGQGDILGHVLTLDAASYTPTDERLIPTGAIASVQGTPFDFTRPTPIGSRWDQLARQPRGYDENFVISPGDGTAARLVDPSSGRVLELTTTEPCLQLYTANYFDGTAMGKGGVRYRQHAGVALEPQRFPDSVNQPAFPSIILRPGETYRQTTRYRFSLR
ncbi:MAG TPA: aldose epimerase family protein [Gemmatimonadales bacterium]|nr:aldose epimerase family protein [Gemmatimonadales bacterium]